MNDANPQQDFERIEALGDEASAYLDVACTVANARFGEATVKDVPLLVTQVAWLMATIETNRISETN